ncbi:hypothetical protein [Acinetobacter pittii]|uniref:hypothetical protein n=1 Tax=Acinetobacter pittii TaxID=48296 RepID=UPI00157FF015|nr:hypothetical protein [Acinetobacter pittii]NUF44939.1 hypothetical protein [Acinetobacter pittii]
MKQTFPMFTAGDVSKIMDELTIGEALSLAKMNPKHREQQLSAFLRYALRDEQLPYTMTSQQRYYFLLQYLGAQKENDLAVGVNVNDYLKSDHTPWQISTEVDGVKVRQLNGLELEALELIAEGLDDWILGAMALQISFGDDLPYIQPLEDRRLAGNIIKNRFSKLMSFGQERINELYQTLYEAEEQMASLLRLGFDSEGIVVYEANGGGDSEPARFQCDAAFYGFTKQLFSALAKGGAETTEKLEYEPE